jgi:hypothetical protein
LEDGVLVKYLRVARRPPAGHGVGSRQGLEDINGLAATGGKYGKEKGKDKNYRFFF